MKYGYELSVDAVYDGGSEYEGNPLMEAMPPFREKEDAFQHIVSHPYEMSVWSSSHESQAKIAMLSTFFLPMDYMYLIYEKLYRAIQTTYLNRDTIDAVRRTCVFHNGVMTPTSNHVDSGSILGVPGIGKTSTIKKCLSLMPQVIRHQEYHGQPFFCKQILWLFVECPSDCSIKALIINIFKAIDKAIGSTYLKMNSRTSMSIGTLSAQLKIVCQTHHIGLLVIDEIQNLVTTAHDGKQTRPLVRFLVELTNETNTAIWMVGTPIVEDLFLSAEHLKRRTRGFRLLPFKPDGAYRRFLETLWQYQYTYEKAKLTDKLAATFYDRTSGIPAYLMLLFQETQTRALLTGKSKITVSLLNETAEIMAIDPPKQYLAGTSISDFENYSSSFIEMDDAPPVQQQRLYANKRGRKPAPRDKRDLVFLYKQNPNILEALSRLDMLEIIQC